MSIENTQLRCNTPIVYMGMEQGNKLYIKRDDLVPYSFGGNKARKGVLFFEEIEKGGYDCVVTYGSSHSNHCRIISNMAAARGLLHILALLKMRYRNWRRSISKILMR